MIQTANPSLGVGTPSTDNRARTVQNPLWRMDSIIGWRMESSLSKNISRDIVSGQLRLGGENGNAIALTEPSGSFGGLTRPTGLAVGEHGRLFFSRPSE